MQSQFHAGNERKAEVWNLTSMTEPCILNKLRRRRDRGSRSFVKAFDRHRQLARLARQRPLSGPELQERTLLAELIGRSLGELLEKR